MALLTLEEINKIDIVDYLASLGYQPKDIRGKNYWYLSMLPDRIESKPSFRVNREKNRWRDFGGAKGTTLVDFGILYFNCTIRELVIKLSGPMANTSYVSRHDPTLYGGKDKKLVILNTMTIRSGHLIHYLQQRRIQLSVAQKYCWEVRYKFETDQKSSGLDKGREYYGIGFPCDAGGYEIRNKFHKYSSSPKSPTFLANGSAEIAVFEGYFNMLTLVNYLGTPECKLPDLLVLNSLAFFESYMYLIEAYPHKYLFLDNDAAGDKATAMALAKRVGYRDVRGLYAGYKDLNQWACEIGKAAVPCLSTIPAVLTNPVIIPAS